jgi:hypothetical protein
MKRKRSEGNNLTLDFMKAIFFFFNWPSDSIAQPKFASYWDKKRKFTYSLSLTRVVDILQGFASPMVMRQRSWKSGK